MNEPVTSTIERAAFAAGCFWGVEARFLELPGVIDAVSGYEGGTKDNPTYRDVCTGRTGHAEAVEVTFDPLRISFEQLLDEFWALHDPTTVDRQGPDVGSQYRSAIFFHSPDQRAVAEASIRRLEASGTYRRPIATQVVPAQTFYRAEDYHQRYFEKNGIACHR